MLNVLTSIWNARQVAKRLARQSAQKHVAGLNTRRVIFQRSNTKSIQFVINKESGQETMLSKLCFVSMAGVLTSSFSSTPRHNDLSLAFLICVNREIMVRIT